MLPLFLFVQCALLAAASQSRLDDILRDTDRFFDGISGSVDDIYEETEKFKLVIKRSYGLTDEDDGHPLGKRSLDGKTSLIRDDKGVYFVRNIEDVARVPSKFPLDIQILSAEDGTFYIGALEANKNFLQRELANHLVLYQLKEGSTIREIARAEISGGYRLATHIFRNVVYLLSSEHDADSSEPFEGSCLYRLLRYEGGAALEKIQILNITQPRDVKLWDHQDQMYLAVSTGDDLGESKSSTLIFKWLDHNFDFIQKIDGSGMKCATPFVIGSSMYLAIANNQDIYGNTNTNSEIFRYHLQSGKFIPYQKIKTQSAYDIAYFKFGDTKLMKEEHFIVVANHFEKDPDGNPNYRTDSVIYKFEDEHFAPFQFFKLYRVLQWIPVQGAEGEFLLVALCAYTVIGFQYDGWRFRKVRMDYGQSPFGKNIVSMRSFQTDGNAYLSAADKSNGGTEVNLWKITFENENLLEKKYNELESWCADMKQKIEADDLDSKIKKLHTYLHQESDPSSIGVKLNMEEAEIDILETQSFDVYNATMVTELNNFNERVKKLRSRLEDLKERFENSKFVVYYDVIGLDEIPYLELDCERDECCSFNNMNIGTLNNEDFLSFINNAVTLNEDILESRLEFENLRVTHDLSPSEINGHPAATLVDTETDLLLNSELIINGTVIIQGDLQISDKYVEHLMSEDEFMQEFLQNFTGELVLETAKVKKLDISGKLNGVEVDKLVHNKSLYLRDSYEKLNIHNLNINGSILPLDTPADNQDSLHENTAANLEFDDLEVDEIFVESGVISGVKISDILQTTEGKYYKVEGEWNFTDTVGEPTNLEVTRSVNGIPVHNWKKEGGGRERSEQEEFNPEVVVVIEGDAYLEDILNPDGNDSITDILDNGILLNETNLDLNLEFNELKIDDATIESINGIPVSSWVLKDTEEVQVIKGKKTFLGDVRIEKKVSVKRLNGIDLEELYNDTLFLDGEQTVTGNVSFRQIRTKSLKTDFVSLGGEELVLKPNRIKIFGSVELDTLTADNVTLNGLIDGLSWDEIVHDSVFNKDRLITGRKTVEGRVQVRYLNVTGTINSIPVEEFMKGDHGKEEVTELVIPQDVVLNSTLEVDDLIFEGSLDSIEKSRFGKEWLLSEGDQILEGDMNFRDVELGAGAVVESETVNKINLRSMFRDSLKVNESIHIKHMAINNIKGKRIDVLGTVNGAKFEDSVLLATSPVPQVVEGDWFFEHDLIINGSLIIEGLVSGINFSQICSQQQSQPGVINLIVGGSVTFEKEPKILGSVNGVNLEETMKEVWFKNEDVILTDGEKKFSNVELRGKARLEGYLNDIDLDYLSKNYFSKTLTRIIPEDLRVKNLQIRKSCRIRNVTVGGLVNGVDLEKWSKTVLLQDVDQVITGKYHFNEFAADNLILNGTVNGLDLARGVLRYDVPNAVVTGEKTFIDITVEDLDLAEGKKIQEVPVEEWMRRAVRKVGNFTIKGNLTLNRPIFKDGIKVLGRVNGLIFDREHILVTSGNQTITGKKTFDLRNYPNETLEVKHLVAKGLVGGVDLYSLIRNQAYTDGDLVFTGRKSFTDVITADRLIVKGLVHGENISEICQDLSRLPQLEDFTDRCNTLLAGAKRINKYFIEKPFFFDYYEHLQTLSDDIFAVLPYPVGKDAMISIITSNEMRLMEWDPFSEQFVYKDDEVLSLVDNVTFAISGTRKSGPFLYMEISNVSKIFFPSGQLARIEEGGTSCVASFDMPSLNKSCFFVGREWNESKIYCDNSALNELETFQTLQTVGTVKASALHVGDDIYITVINKEKVVDRVENILTVYKFIKEFQGFYVSSTLPEVNPVAVATVTYRHHHFLALAGGHLPESVDSSIVTLFRLNKENDVFVRYQSLLVDTPVDVHFAQLPTSELVLYVLSSNPTKPFIVFLFRGIQGFVEETSGPSLYVGNQVNSFTDNMGDHFVFISGDGRGQILKAGFKGNKIPLKT